MAHQAIIPWSSDSEAEVCGGKSPRGYWSIASTRRAIFGASSWRFDVLVGHVDHDECGEATHPDVFVLGAISGSAAQNRRPDL